MNATRSPIAWASVLAACLATVDTGAEESRGAGLLLAPNASGMAATFSTAGRFDFTNPFFQALGTNGRSCETCHQPRDGWSVTPAHVRERFAASAGLDPIFRTNDGAVAPSADVSSVAARRVAYAMLLDKGLIRVGLPIPEGAEFVLDEVDDPYGFASARELSLFRRPLPAANLRFLSSVMWDGRETFTDPTSTTCIAGTTRCFASVHFDLADQANGATVGHAQAAAPLTTAQREAIVAFESGLYFAQIYDDQAKRLTASGGRGGPQLLASVPSYFGINDVVFGDYRTGNAFNRDVFDLYAGWALPRPKKDDDGSTIDARAAVARGEALFDRKPIRITDVKGLNDDLHAPVIDGTCTTCHDTPGGGNHSVPAPLDIGIADAARATPDLPVYVLRNRATGERIATTDPGEALLTGRWRDIGRFKGPVLRGLAARPPYFHNGAAASLEAVVDFYDQRFAIGLTAQEKKDLAAFLRAL